MSVAVVSEERILKVILGPHVSEKSTILAEKKRQFVFKVLPDATKPEIKKAVEHLFNVEVAGVTVCNARGKKKRFAQILGRRKDTKKAYVRLKEGHDIQFMSAE